MIVIIIELKMHEKNSDCWDTFDQCVAHTTLRVPFDRPSSNRDKVRQGCSMWQPCIMPVESRRGGLMVQVRVASFCDFWLCCENLCVWLRDICVRIGGLYNFIRRQGRDWQLLYILLVTQVGHFYRIISVGDTCCPDAIQVCYAFWLSSLLCIRNTLQVCSG